MILIVLDGRGEPAKPPAAHRSASCDAHAMHVDLEPLLRADWCA
jgi:hypothetical protein